MTETISRKEWQAIASKAKASKFRSKPQVLNGVRFASGREAARWLQLELLQRTGQITGLERQVKYPLSAWGVTITSYTCDFRYRDKNGEFVIEDTKSEPTRTPVYRIKKKMMAAQYGITIKEV